MNDLELKKYSVLMAVYCNDEPLQLKEALESLLNQTVSADEVLIVIDGPINQPLEDVLEIYSKLMNIRFIRLPDNEGLAHALKIGILECRNEYVGRMDSDDICIENRFELQLDAIQNNNIDVVGGLIQEFNDNDDKTSIRIVPERHKDIIRAAKYQAPFNHVSVLFKKSKVIESGNYKDFRGVEDYPLWIDMIQHGAKFYNLQKVLVKVRAGDELIERRGGLVYAKIEFKVMRYFYKVGFYNLLEFLSYASLRFLSRTMGSKLRKFVYQMLRN
jgi:glycosyltransferase involved in cell wall biosynthesis